MKNKSEISIPKEDRSQQTVREIYNELEPSNSFESFVDIFLFAGVLFREGRDFCRIDSEVNTADGVEVIDDYILTHESANVLRVAYHGMMQSKIIDHFTTVLTGDKKDSYTDEECEEQLDKFRRKPRNVREEHKNSDDSDDAQDIRLVTVQIEYDRNNVHDIIKILKRASFNPIKDKYLFVTGASDQSDVFKSAVLKKVLDKKISDEEKIEYITHLSELDF